MANESAMRERGLPEPRWQLRCNQAGENHRIESPSSRKYIDWKVRFAAKLTAGEAEARIVLCADNRTISAATADQVAQPMPCEFPARKFWRDSTRGGIFRSAAYCAVKSPTEHLKLLILLVAGAGFEPATFGL